jgi:hypothetical protein
MPFDRLQCLLLRSAREPRPAEGDGDVGPPRLQFGGLAQRELVAGGEQLVDPRGNQGVEEGLDFGRRHGADELADDIAIPERLHGRDTLHVVARGKRPVGVDVDLGQQHPTAMARLSRFQRGAQLFAGPTPLDPEIDDHRGLAGELNHVAVEGRFGYVECHGQ